MTDLSISASNDLSVKKTDMFLIPVSQIVANHDENGRFDKATPEQIRELADSIREYGQKQPVGVKRLPKNAGYRLVYGFGRYEAITLLNSELEGDGEPLRIRAIVVNENDKQQFFSNVIENFQRRGLTPMDYCNIINKMTQSYAMDQGEVAKFFGKSRGWVSQHVSLNNLTYDTQQMVHKGLITFSDAITMAANTDYDEQRKVVASINEAAQKAEDSIPDELKEAGIKPEPNVVAKEAKKAGKEAIAQVTGKSNGKPTAKKEYTVPPSKKEAKSDPDTAGLGKRNTADMRELFETMCDSNRFGMATRAIGKILLDAWDGKIREDNDVFALINGAVEKGNQKMAGKVANNA